MSSDAVVTDDVDSSVKIRARFYQAPDIVMAGDAGTDCVGHAVFLSNDLDGFVRSVLIRIGANPERVGFRRIAQFQGTQKADLEQAF
jgi:hypothetical protein